MADIGQTDLSFKPNVDITAIASLAQKKAQLDQQQAMNNSQMQTQAQDRIMQTIKMASDLTSSTIKNYAETQQLQGQKHVSDILATQNNPISSMVPDATFGQTPQYKGQLQSAIAQAAPEQVSSAIARQQFVPQTGKNQQIVKTMNPDGTEGYTIVDKSTDRTTPVNGITAPASGMNQMVQLNDADRANPVLNNLASAIAEGRALPGGVSNLRTANGQKAVALALEKNPTLDLTAYPQKLKMRSDYSPGGAIGKGLTAWSTAVAHSEIVNSALDKLDNSKFPSWNKITNKASVETGDPRVGAFKVARNLFADEMAKAAQGGSSIITEQERQRQLESFDAASSPEQMRAVIDTTLQLMASKAKVAQDTWNQTMSGIKPPTPFVTSQAARILKKRGYDLDTLEQTGTPEQSNGSNVDLSKFWK